jgi:hypothetical protein
MKRFPFLKLSRENKCNNTVLGEKIPRGFSKKNTSFDKISRGFSEYSSYGPVLMYLDAHFLGDERPLSYQKLSLRESIPQ